MKNYLPWIFIVGILLTMALGNFLGGYMAYRSNRKRHPGKFPDENRVPLLCKMCFHTSTYYDSAMMHGAQRCNKCNQWVDPREGSLVDRERRLWEKYDNPGDVLMAWGRGEEG